jgi:hypothetical protein
MSQFIKLTNRIINTSKIVNIKIEQTKYYMLMSNNTITGYFVISFGQINTADNIIEICKDSDPNDYKIITEWINKIK